MRQLAIYSTNQTEDAQQCDKISYSYAEAHRLVNIAHKRKTSHRNRQKKIPNRAYKCDLCGCWHLTSRKYWNKNEL